MRLLVDIDPCRLLSLERRCAGKVVGFVPTMGALHAGHMALINAARQNADHVVVSIFVNPIQFGPHEDFQRYPRPLEHDLTLCEQAGVDVVFAPTVSTMFPDGFCTTIAVGALVQQLCGPFRPGHFEGVATVVAKLLTIVQPDFALFGEKDYQQLIIVRRMAEDLNLATRIIAHPIVREPDGLAMSSRNAYLTPAQRRQAKCISEALFAALADAQDGMVEAHPLCDRTRKRILAGGAATIDYVSVVDSVTLEPLQRVDRPSRLCVAVRIGTTRLIDNMAVDSPHSAG